MQIWVLFQFRVSDTQVTVNAHGPQIEDKCIQTLFIETQKNRKFNENIEYKMIFFLINYFI